MKRLASLSLDLDNKWSYMKTHGDAGWDSFPSYLDIVVPRALAFLKERDLNITFFVVGQDAALDKNHEALRSIADAGHEIGNHSFNHEPWLHLYSRDELIREFESSEGAISNVFGQRPVGFRGPGYSLSSAVLELLVERGYEYDCSTLPTFIGPFARAYYFFKSPQFTVDEQAKRKKLFGKFSDGLRSLKPFEWQIGDRSLVEIPLTTMPVVKTPIHVSYLIYLSTISRSLAISYWKFALTLCERSGIEPSLLLHPLDLLSGDDAPELKFFPGMRLPLRQKLDLVSDVLKMYSDKFHIINLREHAAAVRRASHQSHTAGIKASAEAV